MAPTEQEAIDALKRVQSLSPEQFEAAMRDDIGAPMMQVFNALARTLHPSDDDDDVAKKLHLMMLTWLMAQQLRAPID